MFSTLKKYFSYALVLLVIAQLIGCGQKQNYSKEVVAEAAYKGYESLSELISNSDIIIVGKVVSINESDRRNIRNYSKSPQEGAPPIWQVFTMSNIEVTDVIKGNVKIGDKIKVFQPGGIYENIKYTTKGVKLFKKDEEKLLFMKYIVISSEAQQKDFSDNFYTLLNPYVSNIDIKNGKVKVDTTENKLIDNDISKKDAIIKIKKEVSEIYN